MKQLELVLNRLKNPSVILSIVSEIVTILVLLNVSVNANLITGIVTSVCSILVLLGILSNPTTKNKGYGDDIIECENCNKCTQHTLINGKMICSECGNEEK